MRKTGNQYEMPWQYVCKITYHLILQGMSDADPVEDDRPDVTSVPDPHVKVVPSQTQEPRNSATEKISTAVFMRPSLSEDVKKMGPVRLLTESNQTLFGSCSRPNFAAIARGAELNAKRAEAARNAALKKKMSGEESVSSDGVTRERSYVVLKPRCSKKKALEPTQPNLDKSTQQIVPTAQTYTATVPLHLTHEAKCSDHSTYRVVSHSSSVSRSRPVEPFPTLLPPSSPTAVSPTTRSEYDFDAWESVDSEDFNVVDPADNILAVAMPRGGKKGFTPRTPGSGSGGQKSRKAASRLNSHNTKENTQFRDHPTNLQVSNNFALTPSRQPRQQRPFPQYSTGMMAGFGAGGQQNMQSYRSTQQQGIDDPFNENTHSTSSNLFGATNAYEQQSGLGNNNQSFGYMSQSSQAGMNPYTQQYYAQQNPYVQRPPYSQSSPYAQQSSYDHSGYQSNTHTQPPPGIGRPDLAHQREAMNQSMTNPRAAMPMAPAAVKGTPMYDSRLATLQPSHEQKMNDFYTYHNLAQNRSLSRQASGQQQVEQTSEGVGTSQDYRSQQFTNLHENTHQDDQQCAIVPYHGRQERISSHNDRQDEQQRNVTPYHLRDPAPYTGFRTRVNKVEDLPANLNQSVEASNAPSNTSSAPRTVLHDPVAHEMTKQPSSTSNASTIKPIPRVVNQPNVMDLPPEQRDPAEWMRALLSEGADCIPYGPGDPRFPHLARTESQKAAASRPVPIAMPRHMRDPSSFKLVHSGGNSPMKKSRFSDFFPKEDTKFTVSGHPIPHGGFADFTTPYDKYLFGERGSYDVDTDTSEAPGNVMMREICGAAPDVREGVWPRQEKMVTVAEGLTLPEGVAWFHDVDRFRDIDTVAKEIEARTAALKLGDKAQLPKTAQTTPQHPKPIGHERASASKSSTHSKTSVSSSTPVTPAKDLMKNPTPEDAADLMSGLLGNMLLHANGSLKGDYFTPWGRPGEWAIDNSKDGNKSLFGGGFEAAPQRVARDPRYQQTVTQDGRYTYFEDPAKGKARAWGM